MPTEQEVIDVSGNWVISCMVESPSKFPFQHVVQAIRFFNDQNPARARSVNLLEPERRGTRIVELDVAAHDLWACVALALKRVLPRYDTDTQRAFRLYWIAERDKGMGKETIAVVLGRSVRTVNRMIRRVTDDLERELVSFEVMDPEVLKDQ